MKVLAEDFNVHQIATILLKIFSRQVKYTFMQLMVLTLKMFSYTRAQFYCFSCKPNHITVAKCLSLKIRKFCSLHSFHYNCLLYICDQIHAALLLLYLSCLSVMSVLANAFGESVCNSPRNCKLLNSILHSSGSRLKVCLVPLLILRRDTG